MSRPRSGQALVETAITIPVMFILLLGFLAVLIRVEAQVELDAATSLAAASAVSAPTGSVESNRFAAETWRGTLHHYPYLDPGRLQGCRSYTGGGTVTCAGSATLRYSLTPMRAIVPFDVTIQSTATARGSEFRSQ